MMMLIMSIGSRELNCGVHNDEGNTDDNDDNDDANDDEDDENPGK